ncbi:hypothetical protein Cgig2_024320 [Carnegiea gigantea]|uniref:Rx N-terminal domain-containing protein n=1 Tax=Carnegiea gigantea TaxID=171969 RepID=A0A9Q1K2P2_9CARY|nr:hypothetical protein Cgig2_024320 [Carnegiea gigantea]
MATSSLVSRAPDTTSPSCGSCSWLKELRISNVQGLISLLKGYLHHLSILHILSSELLCTSSLEEVIRSLNSLRTLKFKALNSLRSLQLRCIPKLVAFPSGHRIEKDILKNLGSRALAEIASAWGFKGQLVKLDNTINTIKDILVDAGERQQHNHAIHRWLGRLKDVVYAADDLFDEFATKASQTEDRGGSKLTKGVKTFFSASNQTAFAFTVSHKAKKIREDLNDIVRDGQQFDFLVQSCEEQRVARKHRPETHSFLTDLPVCTYKWGKKSTAKLSDLKKLNHLRGCLKIELRSALKDPIHEAKEASLGHKCSLEELHIYFNGEVDSENCEALLEGLKPHPNLKTLAITSYHGKNLPNWAQMDNLCTSLPNFVDIHLGWFDRWQQVPTFSHLPFLKCLGLSHFECLDYIESGDALHEVCSSQKEALFFPSLEELRLVSMINLRGWWKEMEEAVSDGQEGKTVELPKLQHLSKLHIEQCPNLMSMPLCPNLEELELENVNDTPSILKMSPGLRVGVATATTSAPAASSGSYSKLKNLCFSNVKELIFLPKECLHHLSFLEVQDREFLSISRLGEVFKSLYSLCHLEFSWCTGLRSLSGGLKHITTLKKLGCNQLDFLANEDTEEGMPWKALNNLQSLELHCIPKLVALPNGLQHLTNLRSLVISGNIQLKELPEWISCLSSLEHIVLLYCPKLTPLPEGFRELTDLKKLEIIGCKGLTKTCQGPGGEDWHKIQHIPHIIF